jgi:beta-lactamase regulating signal transducer with metallopeptidase domain
LEKTMENISHSLLTFLLNALWQAPLAWAVAALACRFMPNGPARHRHFVWVAALLAAILLPVLSTRTPQRRTVQTAPPVAETAAAPAAAASSAATPAAAAPSTTPSVAFSYDWAMALLGAYGLFVAFRLAQLTRALWHAWVIRRDASPGDLAALLARCHTAFSTANVQLLRSDDITGPVALHRAIVLPDAMFAESREDVLATAIGHEMAHIARHDFLLNLLYELLYLPISFHPAAIFIRRGIESSREMACDELVTRHLLEPAVYARSIVTIAGSMMPAQQPGYVLGVFDGDILEERIRSLMERRGGDLRRARIAVTAGVSALALCLAFAGGLSVSAYAQSAGQAELQAAAEAFNHKDFAGAVRHFESASKLDPANLKTKLFLANAYMRQAVSEGQYLPVNDDKPLLTSAMRVYQEVLAADPKNATAVYGIVSLNGPAHQKESRDLVLKLIDADPSDGFAYYTLGVLDWGLAYYPVRQAITALGVSPAVTQIPDAGVRATLRPQLTPYIEEAFRVLQVALDKAPTSPDPMAYLNLMYRLKGMLADDPKESAAAKVEADLWVTKALDAKRTQAAKAKPSDTLDLNGEPGIVVPAPPPPPPPPPPGAALRPRNPAEGGR